MKKNFTSSVIFAALCSLFVTANGNAQTALASYEVAMGSEPITETVFCETPPKDFVLFTGVVANPVKDETMNNTDNCYMVKLDANHDWWANFLNFRLTEPITITEENRYLHFLHYRSALNDGWMVCLNVDWPLEDADKGTLRFDSQNSKEGVWEDVVIDLKFLIDNDIPFSKFMFGVSMDWSDPKDEPGGDFYFDEVLLNNDPLPRGINILQETEMSFFMGDAPSYDKWVSVLDLQNAENTSEVVANPFTEEMEVLNSEQVMKFSKSENAAWWQGTRFKFPGIYEVGKEGNPSYLHVMVNIAEMEEGLDYYVIQLNAKDFSGKEIDSGDALKYWVDDKGSWIDMVFDVTELGYIAEFTVRFDIRRNESDEFISSPAGVFYLDAVSIDGSEDPRDAVSAPTALSTVSKGDLKVYSAYKNIVVEGNVNSIEVFTLSGKKISKTLNCNFRTDLPINKTGIYFIRTVGTNGQISNSKVIVK